MKIVLFIPVCVLLLTSCGGTTEKPKTAEKVVEYVDHKPCSFYVRLPENWKMKQLEEAVKDSVPCNYDVFTEKGYKVLSVSSMEHVKFETDSVDSLYAMAIEYTKFKISSHSRNLNSFVIKGVSPETGHLIYWKRVIGKDFISDLYFDYSKRLKVKLEPSIEIISASFKSN